MIKGVNRQVLEVVNTENPYFERIVFYVKPEYKSENAQFLKSEAEKFSQSVQKPPKTKRPKKEIIGIIARCLFSLSAGAGAVFIMNTIF